MRVEEKVPGGVGIVEPCKASLGALVAHLPGRARTGGATCLGRSDALTSNPAFFVFLGAETQGTDGRRGQRRGEEERVEPASPPRPELSLRRRWPELGIGCFRFRAGHPQLSGLFLFAPSTRHDSRSRVECALGLGTATRSWNRDRASGPRNLVNRSRVLPRRSRRAQAPRQLDAGLVLGGGRALLSFRFARPALTRHATRLAPFTEPHSLYGSVRRPAPRGRPGAARRLAAGRSLSPAPTSSFRRRTVRSSRARRQEHGGMGPGRAPSVPRPSTRCSGLAAWSVGVGCGPYHPLPCWPPLSPIRECRVRVVRPLASSRQNPCRAL